MSRLRNMECDAGDALQMSELKIGPPTTAETMKHAPFDYRICYADFIRAVSHM